MTEIGVYITVTITLLGVAYPILLQVISRLDEKYSSENIVSLFNKEFEGKFFSWSLITSLILIVIWSLNFSPIIQIDNFNFIINSSSSILLAGSSIILVVAFFLFVKKILIYYTPTKFIRYLTDKHSKSKNDFRYFIALSDILLLSIKHQQRNFAITLSAFFYSAFRTEREKAGNKAVVYPDVYYEIVYKSIEELAILKEKKNYALENNTAGGLWLLGELQDNEISEQTYSWIWRNLLLIIHYQQDNMIMYHWETAHQYFSYSLPAIYEEYVYTPENLRVSNRDVVDKRNSERQRFIEFHYAFGGLLTYKMRYDCIFRLFNHTTSQPPRYELLPESMEEIFDFYVKIRDPYDMKYTWISSQYPFPDQSGINADSAIKKWIASYMAILFLRQYTIFPYLSTMRPLDFPNIPQTQGEIKERIDSLDFFKILLSEHLNDKVLLKKLNLDFITHEWCQINEKLYPLDFIDYMKVKLQDVYEKNALTLPISQAKIAEFEISTCKTIESTFEKFQPISNSDSIEGDSDKWYVNGQRMIYSKDAFCENPEAHHMSFDSFLASVLSRRIGEVIASTFQFKKTKTYLLKPEEIFSAIDKLGLSEQHVLIGFGFNIDLYINQLLIPGLTHQKYKNTDFHNFNGSHLQNN